MYFYNVFIYSMQIVQINESPLLVKMNPLARKTDVSYSKYLFSVEV